MITWATVAVLEIVGLALVAGCTHEAATDRSLEENLAILRTWDGTVSSRKGEDVYEVILQSIQSQSYSPDEIGQVLSVIYGGDDDHPPGSGLWNLKYGELLSTYHGAYQVRHPREDQAHDIAPIVGWSFDLFCQHPESLWPSNAHGLIDISAAPAWRPSDGWLVRAFFSPDESGVGFAGDSVLVPVLPMSAGTVTRKLTIEVFENCLEAPESFSKTDPIYSMQMNVEFEVVDLLGDVPMAGGDAIATAIIDAISVELDQHDYSFRDAALDKHVFWPVMRVDWAAITANAQVPNDLAIGLDVTLLDAHGHERVRMVAGGLGDEGRVWITSSHRALLCDEDPANWRARIRSCPPLVSYYKSDIWNAFQAGQVTLWQSDDIDVPVTQLIERQ